MNRTWATEAIADGDKERSGPWPGPKKVTGWDFPGPDVNDGGLNGVYGEFAVANAMALDHRIPLGQRVEHLRWFLRTGLFDGYMDIRRELRAEAQAVQAEANVTVTDGVAVVVGNHRLAMSLGYRHAPVVVATNPEFRWQGGPAHRKHTVARWNSAHPMDWDGLRAALQAAEAGWGGSTSIMGSPQGQASQLTTEQVVELIQAHLQAGCCDG